MHPHCTSLKLTTVRKLKEKKKTSVGRNVGIKRPLCTAAHGGVQGIVDRTIFRTPEEKRNCVSQAQGSIAGRSLTTLSQIRFINTYFWHILGIYNKNFHLGCMRMHYCEWLVRQQDHPSQKRSQCTRCRGYPSWEATPQLEAADYRSTSVHGWITEVQSWLFQIINNISSGAQI
jgi:hypothetical protein